MANDDLILFGGNSNLPLAHSVAAALNRKLGACEVSRFSDGEIQVQITENVRGRDVYVIQSTCATRNNGLSASQNDNLMELMLMADALRRASASRITAVIPYFGYARQDRRVRSARVPISAKVVATMMMHSGISRVLTIDLHAEPIQGFFEVPVDNVYASEVVLEELRSRSLDDNPVVVSPDIGGVVRARAVAKRLNDADLAVIDKRRPSSNTSEVMNLIGDVSGRTCLIIDDMVDTAGTLCAAASALKEYGATRVIACCTHPVLSGDACKTVEDSALDELVVTNTIPLADHFTPLLESGRLLQLDISKLLAEAVKRVRNVESISAMFQ